MRLLLALAAVGCTPHPAPRSTSPESSELPGEYPHHRFQSGFPAPTSKTAEELEEKYLFGDWRGARSELVELGIKLTPFMISDPFGNAIGGNRRGFAHYNLVGVDLIFASDPLLGFRGGEFRVGAAALFGDSLSTEYVGNSFPVQLSDVADQNIRLTYLSITQLLFGDTLSVRGGRLALNSVFGEEFLGSEYFKAFTSVAFDLVPLGPLVNARGAFGYPDTTWGARVKLEPVAWFYVMGGAYNGDPDLKQGTRHGVDFSLDGPLYVIGETGVRRNYGKASEGLAGNLKLGGYYDDGRAGVYLLGDQELVRFGEPSTDRHLGVFSAIAITTDWNENPLPLFVDSGVVLYGPASSRPKDFVAFGVAYGRHSDIDAPPPREFEMTLEWTYALKPVPGLVLQPAVQYLIHPSGKATIPDALAVGLNVNITP